MEYVCLLSLNNMSSLQWRIYEVVILQFCDPGTFLYAQRHILGKTGRGLPQREWYLSMSGKIMDNT